MTQAHSKKRKPEFSHTYGCTQTNYKKESTTTAEAEMEQKILQEWRLYAALFTVVFRSIGGGAVIKLSGNSVKSRAIHQSSTSEKNRRYSYSVLGFNVQRTSLINLITFTEMVTLNDYQNVTV